ncbi:Gfo/Idh/MocA family oxidoreductase [candidate division WOR-3 bacterium]|nr:Gfo/Idh/MocA family oxidoreductase [candidate division WOR-3 bacterium]
MNKINIGIVGLGTIAKEMHVPTLSTFKDVVIKSAAEVDVKRGREFAKKWNIVGVYEDYNKMYDNSDLDAVFICLPNFLHYEAVKKALDRDLHVFCEKPMGLRADEAFDLIKIAKKKDLVLAVGYNRRLEKKYEEAANIVKSLKLGTVLQAHGILVNPGPYAGWIPSSDWFFKDKYGVLYDSAPHLIDIMMHILSDQITEVSASGISTMHGLNVFDNIAGVFKTERGAVGTFNVGWKMAANYDSIQVHGTGGSVFANPFEVEVRHGSYGSLERVADHVKLAKNIIGSQVGRMSGDKRPNETYFRGDRAFVDAVLNNGNPLVSGEDGLGVLEVLEAVKESLEKGESVKVEYREKL